MNIKTEEKLFNARIRLYDNDIQLLEQEKVSKDKYNLVIKFKELNFTIIKTIDLKHNKSSNKIFLVVKTAIEELRELYSI